MCASVIFAAFGWCWWHDKGSLISFIPFEIKFQFSKSAKETRFYIFISKSQTFTHCYQRKVNAIESFGRINWNFCISYKSLLSRVLLRICWHLIILRIKLKVRKYNCLINWNASVRSLCHNSESNWCPCSLALQSDDEKKLKRYKLTVLVYDMVSWHDERIVCFGKCGMPMMPRSHEQ